MIRQWQCIFIILICYNLCFADESKIFSLGTIEVKENLIVSTKQEGDALFTGVSLDSKNIGISGVAANNSVFNAVSILPDINLDSDDPFGLSDKRLRIRGTSDYFIGLTVEGIPNYGIMPIGPRDYIYDTENFELIKIFPGSAPSDLMSGSGNRGGAIELKLKRPENKEGLSFRQSFGSFSYSKTFIRFDSGKFSKIFPKFYTSFSYTFADKWKGKGNLGPRKNLNIGLSKKFNEIFSFDFFINYNSINRNLFKGLTYAESKNLNDYFYHDYNSHKTGSSFIDYDYYGYNKFSGINRDYFAVMTFKLNDNFKFFIKPYYSVENNSKYEGVKFGNFAMVLNKINDSERYGFIAEGAYKWKKINFTVGYWSEITDFKPIIKKYGISRKGLVFKGYGWLTYSGSNGNVQSPYLKLAINFKKIKFQLGVKYFYYKEPSKRGYWYKNGELTYNKTISIKEKSYDKFLPSFGIEFPILKNIKVSFSYSKKYQRPYAYGPLSSFYFKNYKKFISKNITLQNLFDGLDMESVDAFDIIFRGDLKNFSFFTDFFYQKHKNILVSLENPLINLSYQQNGGEAKSYGVEFSSEYNFLNMLNIFANFSYSKIKFSKNIKRNGSVYRIDGKQFPDSPEYMIKTGVIYTFKKFKVIPYFKYISKRYGDALNKEEIGGYGILNLNLNYQVKNISNISLELKNLFNRKYIGRIDTWDDSTGTTTYYAASPFSMIFKVSFNF